MAKDELDLTQVSQAIAEVKSLFETLKEGDETKMKEVAKGVLDPLVTEKLNRISAEMDKKQEQIDKAVAAMNRKHVMLDGKPVDMEELDKKAATWASTAAKRRGTVHDGYTHEDMTAYKAAFSTFLRKDERTLGPDELKALSVGSDPDGGYLVTPDTSGRIVRRVFDTSPMRRYASIQVITTDALEGIMDLDEADAGWAGETTTRSETTTPQLDVWRIPVHELWAKPKATQKLLDDAAIDVEAWLADKIADKFVRKEATAFVNGTGVGQPRGFLTYTAGSTWPGQIQQLTTGVSGGFAAAPNGGDKLITMTATLKPQYLPGAAFFMSRTTLGGVRLLKNSDGAYLWQPSLVAGTPSSLLGYPVAIFDDMPAYTTADALAVAFGDMAAAYQIVDRMGIRTLRDPYSSKPFVEFYSTKRVGGDVINGEALVFLKSAV